MDISILCTKCFKVKGKTKICPHCGSVGAPPPTEAYHLYPGMVIAKKYLIGQVIGYGGFGVVYKAFDLNLGMVVAIKEFFPTHLACRLPGDYKVSIFTGFEYSAFLKGLERFRSEARHLEMFNHNSSFLHIFDFISENNTGYLIMEYLEGQTLDQFLKDQNGSINYKTAVEIIKQVIDRVNLLHQKGIVHRDINPRNIFITKQNQIKIIDFGAAYFSDDNKDSFDDVVTNGYAPPEQYGTSATAIEPTTDVYSIGATLYKCIVGSTPIEAIQRLKNDELPHPSDVVEGIPSFIDVAIMKAMAVDVRYRFKNVIELLEALRGENDEADYPEIEIHRREVKRNAIIISSIVSVLLIIFSFLMSVFFSSSLKKDPYSVYKKNINKNEEIEVCLSYSDNDDISKLSNRFDEIGEKFYDKTGVKVNFRYYSEDDYAKSVQSELEDTNGKVCLYRGDIVGVSSVETEDLSDVVGFMLSNKYDLLFYEQYRDIYGNTSFPMSFDIYFMYVNYKVSNALNYNSWAEFFQKSAETDCVGVLDGGYPCLYKSLKAEKASLECASNILHGTLNADSESSDIIESFIKGDIPVLIGSSKNIKAVNKLDDPNALLSLKILGTGLYSLDDCWMGDFDYCLSMPKNGLSESKKCSAKLFLYYLMSTDVQNKIGTAFSDVHLSVNKDVALAKINEYNQEQNKLIEFTIEDLDKVIFVDNYSEEYVFGEKFSENFNSENGTYEQVEKFLKTKYFN